MSPFKNQTWPNEKQKLLLQVAFGEAHLADHYFQAWSTKYGLADLDGPTRTILPIVIQNVQRLQRVKPSEDLIKRYQRYYQQVWFDNSVKLKQAFTVISLFNQHNIKACLLKGAAMLLYYYKNMGMRPTSSDFDILLAKKDIPQAIKLLRTLDFNPKGFFEWSGARFESSILHTADGMDYAHAITYRKEKLEIDLHWKCLHIANDTASFEGLFSQMRAITIFNNQTYVFSPEFHLFHTCVHGMMQMSTTKFTWIMDILYLLTQYQQQFEWTTLYEIAKKQQSLPYIRDLLQYIEQINPTLVAAKNITLFKNTPTTNLRRTHIIHHIHTSSFRLLRKPLFYISIYLANMKNKSVLAKAKHFPNFIRKYFGIQTSLVSFMWKKFLKNTARNID